MDPFVISTLPSLSVSFGARFILSVIGSTDAPLTGFPLESTTITFDLAQATNVNKRNRIPDKIEVRFILFFEENVSVHQIRPTQRTFTTSITFPLPVNQLPTSAVGFGWHDLLALLPEKSLADAPLPEPKSFCHNIAWIISQLTDIWVIPSIVAVPII